MPLEAAEMALLRLIHAAELPDPGALIERLNSGEAAPAPARARAAAPARERTAPPESFTGLIRLLKEDGKQQWLAQQLEDDFRLVDYAPPTLLLQAARSRDPKAIEQALTRLRAVLAGLFEVKWRVELAEGEAQPTIGEQETAAELRLRQEVLDAPAVKAALEAFPGAELADYAVDERRNG
jgi:DNA polymerase-3 subunit gamma/tau